MNRISNVPVLWKRVPIIFICLLLTTGVLMICISQLALAQQDEPDSNHKQTTLATFESSLEQDSPPIIASGPPTTHYTYLPAIFKPFILIINNNGDGNFVVDWGSIGANSTYTLYEAVEPTFNSPHIHPITMDTAISVTGKTAGTHYFRVQGTKQNGEAIWSNTETAVVTYLTIDDFEDMQLTQNRIGGSIKWHNDLTETCVLPNPGGQVGIPHSGNFGYRLTYAVTSTCYAAWQSSLLHKDYSGFKEVTFWIKGALGNEIPNIYLQNSATQRCYVNIEEILSPSKVTTEWQKVRIPLTEFSSCGVNLKNIEWFQIVFEWASMSGTVYIDDIKFE